MSASPARPLRESAAPGKKRRWLIRLFLLLILVCGGWWGVSFIYHLMTFHPAGQIVFECNPDQIGPHLCIVNADGSGYTQHNETQASNGPAWSPDGKRIAFTAYSPKQADGSWQPDMLYVMNSDGSGLTQLTDIIIKATSPSWSPDGDRIVFSNETYTVNNKRYYYKNSIAFVSPHGGEVKFLPNSSEVESEASLAGTEPSWSPDGTQIAFNKRVSDYESYIYIMNSDGSNQRQLTSTWSKSPSWSPDGTKLAFDCVGVCVINLDGSGLTSLGSGTSPTWSPDGQYIAYSKPDPWCLFCYDNGQLWVMKADGSQQTRITGGPADEHPAWRPVP